MLKKNNLNINRIIVAFHKNRKKIENKRLKSMLEEFIKAIAHQNLPRYMEAGYSPLGRAPVVDALLADPFYMPQYTEIVTQLIKKHTENNLLFPLVTSLQIASGIPTAHISNENMEFEEKSSDNIYKIFPSHLSKKIISYWQTFISIHQEVESIFSVLSHDEKHWLMDNYNAFFYGTQSCNGNYEFFTTENPSFLTFFELASYLDLARLVDCARKLCIIADDFYQSRAEFSKLTLNEDIIVEENELKLFISQKTHVEHTQNADFFIDLGGNNTLYTHAGGSEGKRLLALHLDLKGNNTYFGEHFVQGSGFLGVGILASCSGNNVYHAKSYSQGCGFFGVGILVNLEGNNRFNLDFAGQSFASFGYSMVWNKQGKNEYRANQGLAQAASSTLGAAFLIDNQGSNTYIAGISDTGEAMPNGGIAQAGSSGVRYFPWLSNPSLYGGLSFLYAGGGDNIFKTVWIGQGSAYFLGAAILVVEGSEDIFKANYDAQGQGLHLAAGLLLKKGSYNRFDGGWGSLGVSGDRSVGMFISHGEHNIYEGTNHCIGSSRKPKSVGVFISVGGYNTYTFQKISNTSLQYPDNPKGWPYAFFLEIGKDSSYPDNVDNYFRGDDKQWGLKNHSIGISTSTVSEDIQKLFYAAFHESPRISFPFDPINGWESNTAYRSLVYTSEALQDLALEIASANYDRRRQIYEILDLERFKNRKVTYDLSYLLKEPAKLEEDAFIYSVLWALRNKEKADLSEIKRALKANTITSDYARKMAVSLVTIFWAQDTIPLLSHLLFNDTSEEIRYLAALALAVHSTANMTDLLQLGLQSKSEQVRFAIAKGLQESKNPYALMIVTPLFNDESFYVRRAAGLTALSLGDEKGVDIVLETLEHDSLDTTDNYGDNIYKQLSNYLNVDFGVDKQAWRNWWNQIKNRDN